MGKINITIASRYEDDRNAISALLAEQDDFKILSVVDDSYGLVNSAIKQQPDVVVMDFHLEDRDSLCLAPVIKRNSPATALIVLCSQDERIAVGKVLKAGISGYLLKQQDFANLVSSIRCVFCGGLYISEMARKQIPNYFSAIPALGKGQHDSSLTCHSFTLTELQIFSGIIRGATDAQIAKNLNISTGTVRNCICKAKKRVGLKSRAQMVLYILSHGLVVQEDGLPFVFH